MALNLSIIKSPPGVALTAAQKVFSEQGGTIGRGDSNDWVLSDPDRFLSSRHCGLSFEGGQYYLTDMSTNGTFINGAPEPLGKGGKIPLNDGDVFEVGDYQFRADVQPDIGFPGDPFAAAPNTATTPDPFGAAATSDLFKESPDPFADPPEQASSNDPFVKDPFSATESVSLNPDSPEVDPLAALDKASYPNSTSGSVSDFAVQNLPSSDHLFASNPVPIESDDFPVGRPTHGDGADALNQSVEWPDAKNENLIPEGWDDDDLLGSGAQAPPSPPIEKRPARVPSPHDAKIVNEAHRSIPLTDPPKPRNVQKPKPQEPLLAERKPDRAEIAKSDVDISRQDQANARVKKHQPQKQTPSASHAVGDALVQALGLNVKEFSCEEADALHSAIGELMPVIITGMMQVLRSRASIKNEFRMNVTTIQPIENNPLKFSADANEAIDNMFVRKSSAYMGAAQAFQEGFDGIGEHQVAIIAGIRAAFKSMMDRFNPQSLEHQFDKQNKGVVLPGMQKTKYWNSYIDYYNGFVDNMENTFQYLFGDEFVQAYEDQLRRLAAERKKRQKLDQ